MAFLRSLLGLAIVIATAPVIHAKEQIGIVSLFNPGLYGEPLYGSVVSVGPTATSYNLECKPTLPSSPCLLPTTPFPFVQGPHTVSYVVASVNTYDTIGSFTNTISIAGITVTCSIEGHNDFATCSTGGAGLPETDTFALQTSITSRLLIVSAFAPVTITGNLGALPSSALAAASSASGGGAAASTKAGAAAGTTGTATTGGGQAAPTGGSSAASKSGVSTASSKGAGVTQAAVLGPAVLVGAAAVAAVM